MQDLMKEMAVSFINTIFISKFKEGILSNSDLMLFEKGGISMSESKSVFNILNLTR